VRHYSECADIVQWTSPKCHIEAKMQNKKNGMQTRKSASGKNSTCNPMKIPGFFIIYIGATPNGRVFLLLSFLVQKTNFCFFMALLAKMLRTTQTEILKPNV
jgi:hypothetical protein